MYQVYYEVIHDVQFMINLIIKLKENSVIELNYLMLQLLFQLTNTKDMNVRLLNVHKLIKKGGLNILMNHLIYLFNLDDIDFDNYSELKDQALKDGKVYDKNYTL